MGFEAGGAKRGEALLVEHKFPDHWVKFRGRTVPGGARAETAGPIRGPMGHGRTTGVHRGPHVHDGKSGPAALCKQPGYGGAQFGATWLEHRRS